MEQIKRIKHYEDILNRGEKLVNDLINLLIEYDEFKPMIKDLENYYQSQTYMEDVNDDENHKIPQNLTRGILSEDLIYNLLLANDYLNKKYLK